MGNIVICLESILFFLGLKERKGKYCCELLSRQKISRTVPIKAQQKMYLTKKKPLVFIVIKVRKKMRRFYLAVLITILFPLPVQ